MKKTLLALAVLALLTAFPAFAGDHLCGGPGPGGLTLTDDALTTLVSDAEMEGLQALYAAYSATQVCIDDSEAAPAFTLVDFGFENEVPACQAE